MKFCCVCETRLTIVCIVGLRQVAIFTCGYIATHEQSESSVIYVLQEHKALAGQKLTEVEAKVKYTQLARSLKTYGITFFLVKVSTVYKNSCNSSYLVMLTFKVQLSFIHFLFNVLVVLSLSYAVL